MRIDFDPAKDATNMARHGLSLAFGARLFDDPVHLVLPSRRPADNEVRWKVIGLADGRLYTAVHVWRGDAIRFTSVRRSNTGEERVYHKVAGRPA